MSSKIISTERGPLSDAGSPGYEVSPAGSPLTRLNYFDGKFLRAEGFREEQSYVRMLAALGVRAVGAGIVYGMDAELAEGDMLRVLPGLAMEPSGRALVLASQAEVSISELIAKSRGAPTQDGNGTTASVTGEFGDCTPAPGAPPASPTAEADLFLVTAHATDWLCGQEDVYGLLCQQACYTETQHPYIKEGVVLRATPLRLSTPLITSSAVSLEDVLYRRSRVASAYFADEATCPADQISHAGLLGGVWCKGAPARVGDGVALAILGRSAGGTDFLDMWSARRELIDPSPRRYWAWRMRMRPWDVFLAQVLQFQCQLSGVLSTPPKPKSTGDLCRDEVRNASAVMEEVAGRFTELKKKYDTGTQAKSATSDKTFLDQAIPMLMESMDKVRVNLSGILRAPVGAPKRILLERGIVELPSGGYLPVATDGGTVNDQVRALLGEGLDLRFCVVRPDYVAHALEEVQHMDRISLVQGLDNAKAKPRVDILVPDGVATTAEHQQVGRGYDMKLALSTALLTMGGSSTGQTQGNQLGEATGLQDGKVQQRIAVTNRVFSGVLHGAARGETLTGGGAAFHFAGLVTPDREGALALMASCAQAEILPDLQKVYSLMTDAPSGSSSTGQDATGAQGGAGGTGNTSEYIDVLDSEMAKFRTLETAVDTPSAAMWASMNTARDPFALGRGDATALHLEMYFLLASGTNVLRRRIRFDGNLLADAPASRTLNGEAMTGTFTGEMLAGTQTTFLSGFVKLRRTSAGAHPDVEVWMEERQLFVLTARRHWTSNTDAMVCASARTGGAASTGNFDQGGVTRGTTTLPLISASQSIDDAALSPGSSAYADSTDALDLFATHGEGGLAAAWRRTLFPPKKATTDALVIKPRLGWVLFARRREERCGGVTQVVTPPQQRFQALHLSVSREQWKALLAGLDAGNDGIWKEFTLTPVGWVDFPAGERVPVNAAADLVHAWLARNLQNEPLVMGAVAQDDYGSGGQALARGRVEKVVARLGQVGNVASNVDLRVLPSVPANVSPAGFDGAMVLVTSQLVIQEVVTKDKITVKKEVAIKTGTIKVVVHDRQGAPVQGAKVSLWGCGPQSTATDQANQVAGHCTSAKVTSDQATDAQGTTVFPGLSLDFHQVTVDPTSVDRKTAVPFGGKWTVDLSKDPTPTVEFTVA